MIGVVVATEREARPLLAQAQARQVAGAPFPVHALRLPGPDPEGVLVISGIGPVAARQATEHLLAGFPVTRLVNAGAAGALRAGFPVFAVFRGDSAVGPDGAWTASSTGDWRHLRPARLATVAEPVFGGERRARLAADADLVDMEGAVVASLAKARGIPCALIKGVSDLAGSADRQTLERNLDQVAMAVAAQVLAGLAGPSAGRQGVFRRLLDFVKAEHTIFSLPLLLAGAWLGAGRSWPSPKLLALILLAGVGARTVGMAANRLLDRRLDALNPRTATRHLPSGSLSIAQGLAVAGAGLAVFLGACALLGGPCLRLSPLPLLLLLGYSLLKRRTSLCHFGIGACLAVAPLSAHVAAAGAVTLDPAALLLGLFSFCWMSGFDIVYAMQDLDSDRLTGVKSLPASLGPRHAMLVAGLTHLVAILAAAALAAAGGGGAGPWIAWAVASGALSLAQHPRLPLPARFFPLSAVAGVAGAAIPLLGARP